MSYIIAIHIPIAGLAVLPLLFGFPLLLLPAQIALLELIIDPACSIVFEAQHSESDTLLRPPRSATASLFDRRTVILSLLQGLGILTVVMLVLFFTRWWGMSVEESRTLTFITLVFGNLMLIAANLSRRQTIFQTLLFSSNRPFLVIITGVVILLPVLIYLPHLHLAFHFASVSPVLLFLAALLGGLSLVWSELLKLLAPRLIHR